MAVDAEQDILQNVSNVWPPVYPLDVMNALSLPGSMELDPLDMKRGTGYVRGGSGGRSEFAGPKSSSHAKMLPDGSNCICRTSELIEVFTGSPIGMTNASGPALSVIWNCVLDGEYRVYPVADRGIVVGSNAKDMVKWSDVVNGAPQITVKSGPVYV